MVSVCSRPRLMLWEAEQRRGPRERLFSPEGRPSLSARRNIDGQHSEAFVLLLGLQINPPGSGVTQLSGINSAFPQGHLPALWLSVFGLWFIICSQATEDQTATPFWISFFFFFIFSIKILASFFLFLSAGTNCNYFAALMLCLSSFRMTY